MKTLFSATAIALMLAACNPQPATQQQAAEPAALPTAPATGASVPSAGHVKVPSRYALQPNEQMPLVQSWETYLASLSVEDRQYVASFNAKYAGALEFASPDELQRMAALGIPLPSEILESRKFTDSELKAMASSGNIKAQMLYADRAITSASAAPAAAKDSSSGTSPALDAILLAAKVAQSDPSPFGAYLDGRARYELGVDRAPEYMAGALVAAQQRGDTRATAMLNTFSQNNPEMRASTVNSVAQSLSVQPKQ